MPVVAMHGVPAAEARKGGSGMQAVLIGERITGRGVVQAVDHAVGVPLWEIEPLLGALVLALLVGAVYPRRKYASRRSQACIPALPTSSFIDVYIHHAKAFCRCRGTVRVQGSALKCSEQDVHCAGCGMDH